MENLNWQIILTALITSGFTIVLTKLFDFLKTKQDYKIHQKRLFFERKLNYAEKTVEYLNEKAELFDGLANVFKQMDFISKDTNDINMETVRAFDWLQDLFLDDLDVDDLFAINIPPAAWLYFKISPNDLPNDEFNKSNVALIKHMKPLEKLFENIENINIPKEQIGDNPTKEQVAWILEAYKFMAKFHIGFMKWANLLMDASDKLKRVSIKIEREFQEFR